ncbi:MAG: S-layer homology domain-containing protein [Peptococcaceae bacterium]|nr:S-layer homology domain-containing protein [Peptococcaceae bacterium]
MTKTGKMKMSLLLVLALLLSSVMPFPAAAGALQEEMRPTDDPPFGVASVTYVTYSANNSWFYYMYPGQSYRVSVDPSVVAANIGFPASFITGVVADLSQVGGSVVSLTYDSAGGKYWTPVFTPGINPLEAKVIQFSVNTTGQPVPICFVVIDVEPVEIVPALGGGTTRFGSLADLTDVPDLTFETADGKVKLVFNESVNLTSFDTVNTLISLEQCLELTDGSVRLDVEGAEEVLRETDATVTLSGLPYYRQPEVLLEGAAATEDDFTVGQWTYSPGNSIFSFTTKHFSKYDAAPYLKVTNPNTSPVSVGNSTASYTLEGEYDAAADLYVNGQAVSGDAAGEGVRTFSQAVDLNVGSNSVEVKAVVRGLPANVKNYTITRSGGGGGGGGGYTPAPERNTVSAAGGTVSGSGATITFPAGAVPGDIKIKVEKVTGISGLPVPANGKLLGDVLEITKDRPGSFTKPVTVTLAFDKSRVDTRKYNVSIFWFDEDGRKWVELKNVKVDLEAGKVSGEADHFTKFAVLALEKPVEPPAQELILKDIAGHWSEAAVKSLLQSGAVSGYPDGTFRPDSKITRAEFAALLVKAFKLQIKAGKVFDDTSGHWSRDIVSTAWAYGIASGYSDSSFGPDDPVTREQMAAMVVKAAKLVPVNGQAVFADSADISGWAREAVAAAAGKGIIKGYPDLTFKPRGNATRAEAVAVILNALK